MPLLLLLLALFAPAQARADGMMWDAPSAKDLVLEKSQEAWLEHANGRERLVVAVAPGRVTPHLAWLLPLPVRADQVRLSLADKLPRWEGREVRADAQLTLHPVMTVFYFLLFGLAGAGGGQFAIVLGIILMLNAISIGPSFGPGGVGTADAVRVSKHTELGGLASELAEAPSLKAFEDYLAAKSCALPDAAREAVGEHLRTGGSFVVSWAQAPTLEKSLAVQVEFPAAKPWYPVRLTSGYGDARTPIDLHIAGWWTPGFAMGRLRTGYYAGSGEPRTHTRALYEGRASGLTQDWTFRSRGWSPDLRLAAAAAGSPLLFAFLTLLAASLVAGTAAGWAAFPDWRGRGGLWPLAMLGASGLLPVIGPKIALRRLRSERDGVPTMPVPEGMTADEVRLLKRSGLGLMLAGAACELPLAVLLDSVVPLFSGMVLSALGVVLFLRGKGYPWTAAAVVGVFTAPVIVVGPLACAIPEHPREIAAGLGRRGAGLPKAAEDPLPEGMDAAQILRWKMAGGFLMAAAVICQTVVASQLESGTFFVVGTAMNAAGAAVFMRARGNSWAKSIAFGLAASWTVLIGPLLCLAARVEPPEPPSEAETFALTPAEKKWGRVAVAAAALALFLNLGASLALGRAWSLKDATASLESSSHGYGNLIRKSNEGACKGNLGAIRTNVAVYAGDHEGKFPAELSELTRDGKYMSDLPKAKTPNYHPDTDAVTRGTEPDDSGGWLYDPASGAVKVNCTHTDTKGSAWDSY